MFTIVLTLAAAANLSDASTPTAVATVIASVIAAGVGYATHRSTTKANTQSDNMSSFTELVKEAGERSARVYKRALDLVEEEQQKDRAEIARLKTRVTALETELTATRSELETAKAALKIKYRDEP